MTMTPPAQGIAAARRDDDQRDEQYRQDMKCFRDLLAQASSLLDRASKVSTISDLHRTQAQCAARLSSVQLYRVIGQPCAEDAKRVEADFEFVVNRVAEPLLTTLAFEASDTFGEVDGGAFSDHLSDALSDTRAQLSQAEVNLRG